MRLARFATTMVRRRRWVVAVWALILVAAAAAASVVGADHHVDYTMPGSGSARAQQLLGERFPELSGDTVQLVLASGDQGNLDTPALAARLDDVQVQARAVEHVSAVRVDAMSTDHTVALVSVQLDATAEKVPPEAIHELMDIAKNSTDPQIGLTVEAGGGAVQTAEMGESGSEGIGMAAALIILLIVFGSVLAAGLPILVAVFGLGVALSVTTVLTHVFMVPDWAPGLVTMIGLGVGIDYALFILTRYRTALSDGQEPEAAIVTAITTAGRAVMFAGGTVVISLIGLAAMRLEYLYGTAAVTVVGVLIVLIASMTLLPAILGFAGHNINRLRVPFVRGERGERGLWARWSHVVQRKPVVTGTIALVVLVGLAAPAVNLRFGYPDAGTGPTNLTSRRAYDLVADAFGKGANGPLVVAVELEGDEGAADRVQAALAADPGSPRPCRPS